MRSLLTLIGLAIGHLALADDVVENGDRLPGIGINEGSIVFEKAFPAAHAGANDATHLYIAECVGRSGHFSL